MTTVTLSVYLPDYNAEVTLTLPFNRGITSADADTGNGGAEIARRRCCSIKTVSYQKSQIYRKPEIRNDMTLWLGILLRYKPVLKKTGSFMNFRSE